MKRAPKQADPTPQGTESEPRQASRRAFLSTAGAGAIGALTLGTGESQAQELTTTPAWMTRIGAGFRGYGSPSRFEQPVQRTFTTALPQIAPGTGASFTPLQSLQGSITPSGLHFERHHNGVPDIDPAQHRLAIHGLVRRPLVFSIEALRQYPMVSRVCFIECAGNSGRNALSPKPAQATAGALHGLISNSEWTGVPLRILLEEAGIEAAASWLLVEGADAAAMSRSVPLEKALDDALVALFQNGEMIRPEQGYPVRLVLPGWEGNMSVKWLRRIKLVDGPTHTRDETSRYTDPLPDGRARQFTFEMEVKSVITHPSFGQRLTRKGLHEISGLAWSGAGRVKTVEVSVDGGQSWRTAQFDGVPLPKAMVRFRLPFEWNGEAIVIMSRASDEKGAVQPTRAQYKSANAVDGRFHNNAIQSWAIAADGTVSNVYA